MRLAFEIALIIICYVAGYFIGWKQCFEYLMEEIKKRIGEIK